jgi:hypothetical protein
LPVLGAGNFSTLLVFNFSAIAIFPCPHCVRARTGVVCRSAASKVNTNARIIPAFQRKKGPFTNSVSATTTYENGKNLIVYQRETGTGMLRNRS